MGWRYLLFTLGGLMLLLWSLRFFVFSLLESPRFLCGIGKDAEAVDVICNHIKALFATPKTAWSTSLLIAVWGQFIMPRPLRDKPLTWVVRYHWSFVSPLQ